MPEETLVWELGDLGLVLIAKSILGVFGEFLKTILNVSFVV
jgi:hypothetical protein